MTSVTQDPDQDSADLSVASVRPRRELTRQPAPEG
jgi:hypothetical protein